MPSSKVLIVEDELLVAADIQASLEKYDLEIVGVAEDYEQALLLTERHMPDLVLMDIQLRSRRNGIEAAAVIRDRWQIPVVFLTANANEQSLSAARAAAPYGFLTKPFRMEELTETVRIALDQRHATRKLFTQQHWLNAMLATLTDAVVATDSKGYVRFLNSAAEKMTGWLLGEAEGKTIEEIFHLTNFDGTPVALCPARQALGLGGPTPKEQFCLRRKDGWSFPVELSAAAIMEDGQLRGAVIVNIDITARMAEERRQEIERDRLEEQTLNAIEALGQTRADLRLLAANLMRTEEEERRRIGRELHDDLGQQAALFSMLIERVAAQMPFGDPSIRQLRTTSLALSDGLRDVSHRLHPVVIEHLGLSAALEGLIDQQRSQGQDVLFTAGDVPSTLPLNEATALYRIAQEGLRNAAKHASGSTVHLKLWVEENQIVLQIEDEGPGISPVELRATTGLGLLSMQERVRFAGGNLLLTSRPGEGTVLLIRLPLGE